MINNLKNKMYDLRNRALQIAKSKPFVDDIVNSLSPEEKKMLGTSNGEYLSLNGGECVIKRFIYFVGRVPVTFCDVFNNTGDNYIDVAIATRNGQEFRGHGFGYRLANQMINWYKLNNELYDKQLIWMTQKYNIPSNKLALKIGMVEDKEYNMSSLEWNCYKI